MNSPEQKFLASMALELHVVAKGVTEGLKALTPGDVVRYQAHVPGGNVKIEFPDGTKDIAHPACFRELR